MERTRRTYGRLRTQKKRVSTPVITAAASLLLLALLALVYAHRPPVAGIHAQSSPKDSTTVAIPAAERRKVYPYSVIPAGAYSNYELVRALASDPVAARHYTGFGLVDVKLVTAPDQAVYMSYRKRDMVYWTGHPARLVRGEALLTDGTNCARARCGNRLSPQPMSPTAADEPTPQELNHPELPVLDAASAAAGGTPLTLGPGPEAIPSPLFSTLQPVTSGRPIIVSLLPLAPGQISPAMFPGGLPSSSGTRATPLVPCPEPVMQPSPMPILTLLTPPAPLPLTVSALAPPTVPVPSYPAQPSAPAGPTSPAVFPPATPVYPDIPAVPTTAETPGSPASPGTPGAPVTPGTPDTPPSPPSPPPEYFVPEPALGLPAGVVLALLGSLALLRYRTGKA